jgi:hypothetical protein
MLTYFSTTIREEYQRSSGPTWIPPKAPTRVRLIGGDSTAHLDLIHWMTSCCNQNTIVPLSSIIASPTRFILAMTSIHILGITLLQKERPALLQRLENEMLDIDTVGKVFASGDHVLPEIRSAICTCVAGYFFAGRLQDVDRWMHLGKMNRRFDEGICEVLEATGNRHKIETWGEKATWKYPTSTRVRIESQRQDLGFAAGRPAIPGQIRSPNSGVEHPGAHTTTYYPPQAPPPPLGTPHMPSGHLVNSPYYSAYQAVSHLPHSYYPYPIQSVDNLHMLRKTPSPTSSYATESPRSRFRRVHFEDTQRPSQAPTPPPASWSRSRPQQLDSRHPFYQTHAVPPYQQPFSTPYGTSFPQLTAPAGVYPHTMPGDYLYRIYN